MAESMIVLALLLCHAAHWGAFLAMGVVSVGAALRFRPVAATAWDVRIPRAAWAIFAVYGAWYLVNALAPETLADGTQSAVLLPVKVAPKAELKAPFAVLSTP